MTTLIRQKIQLRPLDETETKYVNFVAWHAENYALLSCDLSVAEGYGAYCADLVADAFREGQDTFDAIDLDHAIQLPMFLDAEDSDAA